MSKSDYSKTFKLILDSVDYIQKVENDNEMNDAYIDGYMTKQQRLRDKEVTELLSLYVSGYKYKNKSNKWYKGILLGLCSLILLVFSGVFIFLVLKVDFANAESSVSSVIELISVCITFLTLIVGILTIITKYVFPENEEQYITKIVEIIQNNDLENKKENIRAKASIEVLQNQSQDITIDSVDTF